MTPYASSGTFPSRVFDAGQSSNWGTLAWTNVLPTGTAVALSVRTGNTPTPDGSWTAFQAIGSSGSAIGATSRYLQYQAALSTTDPSQTPQLQSVTIGYSLALETTPPTSVITFPVNGSSYSAAAWTGSITGTASDNRAAPAWPASP